MKLTDAWIWKSKWERMEDAGNAPDLADFIADIQDNAINATLAKARQNMTKALRKVLNEDYTETD